MSVWSKKVTPAMGAAWVTGASSGIGRATALRLADEGWTVWVSARRAEKLDEMSALNANIRPLAADVTDAEAMAKAVGQITADGPLALAILNAGAYHPMRAQTFSAATARDTFDVNLNGVVNALEPAMAHMIERGDGHIAITASVAGYRGLPRAAAYSATKAALIAMAEALAFDLIDLNVRISVINPGFVTSEATAQNKHRMPFLMETDEAAKRIVEGLKQPGFEIAFPRRFAFLLRAIGALPNQWYFAVMRKMMGWPPDKR